jgi:hypothetical protein
VYRKLSSKLRRATVERTQFFRRFYLYGKQLISVRQSQAGNQQLVPLPQLLLALVRQEVLEPAAFRNPPLGRNEIAQTPGRGQKRGGGNASPCASQIMQKF